MKLSQPTPGLLRVDSMCSAGMVALARGKIAFGAAADNQRGNKSFNLFHTIFSI